MAATRERVRWGIIGCGSIASSAIAPAVTWAEGCELVAVGSRTEERAKAKAAEVGAARAYGTYEALLGDPDIDVVYIGLPNGEHARWAIAAAAAGKHVLCDKSLALEVQEARSMREAFRERGLVLVEGFMVRHHPQWTLVRELLAAGVVGGVQHVRAWLRATLPKADDHRWSKTLGGGALFDVTCYPVNSARLVLGEEPIRAQATAKWAEACNVTNGYIDSDGPVDVSTDALLEFPSGAVASVHGSLRAPYEQGVVIAGERGRIVLDRPYMPHWDPTEVIVETTGDLGAPPFRRVHAVPGANHFLHLVEHVARCIRDRDHPLFPAEDGVANVEACVMIADACRAK